MFKCIIIIIMDVGVLLEQWKHAEKQIEEKQRELISLKKDKESIFEKIKEYSNEVGITKRQLEAHGVGLSKRSNYTPLSYKYLNECLSRCIKDNDSVVRLVEYIKSRREIKETQELVIIKDKDIQKRRK